MNEAHTQESFVVVVVEGGGRLEVIEWAGSLCCPSSLSEVLDVLAW